MSRFADRLRQEHALRRVIASDGRPSMVLMTEEERREAAAEMLDKIEDLHGPRSYGPRCKSCVELHPCQTYQIIHAEDDQR